MQGPPLPRIFLEPRRSAREVRALRHATRGAQWIPCDFRAPVGAVSRSLAGGLGSVACWPVVSRRVLCATGPRSPWPVPLESSVPLRPRYPPSLSHRRARKALSHPLAGVHQPVHSTQATKASSGSDSTCSHNLARRNSHSSSSSFMIGSVGLFGWAHCARAAPPALCFEQTN